MSVLSRYTNIISGEKYMTEQNALRHYISKAHKVQKRQNFEEMYSLYSEATKYINVDFCYKCVNDDFGYCGLRRKKTTWVERFTKYCFDGFIRDMEHELKCLQNLSECPF